MKNIALVLGGGGMRGMSHIGVLKALQKRKIKISQYIGCSIGALISSFAASGIPPKMIEKFAKRLTKEDILDFHCFDILRRRLKVGWIYRGERLLEYLKKNLPVHTFDELTTPLYINSINLNSGNLIYWGLPSFRDVTLAEAVYSSCAYPIAFKPIKIKDEYYIDAGIVDNLPIKVTRFTKPDLIIAVNLRYRGTLEGKKIENRGVISVIDQVNSMMGQVISEYNYQIHRDLHAIFIHPIVNQYNFLDFSNIQALIDEGERATYEILDKHPLFSSKDNGFSIYDLLFKTKPIFNVDHNKCTGCGNCIIQCPADLYKIDSQKAVYLKSQRDKCIACLDCIKQCPYKAISLSEEKQTFSFSNMQYLQNILRK